jgi:hypothetical protein
MQIIGKANGDRFVARGNKDRGSVAPMLPQATAIVFLALIAAPAAYSKNVALGNKSVEGM